MCARYIPVNNLVAIIDALGENLIVAAGLRWEHRVLPSLVAPVIRQVGDFLRVDAFRFGLVPAWSKDERPKFATHNARLDSVLEKPSWREPFAKRHCLVPMTAFLEAVHEGPHAHHWIRFETDPPRVLFAAGIWETTDSFSILTDDPHPTVLAHGHDRTPIFLGAEAGREWIAQGAGGAVGSPGSNRANSSPNSPSGYVDFLRARSERPEWRVFEEERLKSKPRSK